MKIKKYVSGLPILLSVLPIMITCSCSQPIHPDDTKSIDANFVPAQTEVINPPVQATPTEAGATNTPLPATTESTSTQVAQQVDRMVAKKLPVEEKNSNSTIEYTSQSGDTLYAIAAHFNVPPDQIRAVSQGSNLNGFIECGTILQIPKRLDEVGPAELILPDSEVVYSLTAADFDLENYIHKSEGYLSDYTETLADGSDKSYQIIQHVASNNSINPKLLLTVLEYQSNWVYGNADMIAPDEYPMKWFDLSRQGLNQQMNWAADQLNTGYYGWRDGSLTSLRFPDGSSLRLAPSLNAGTAAIQYLMSRFYNYDDWYLSLYGPNGVKNLHEIYFGDAWERAKTVEPLIPAGLTQPILYFPFQQGHAWNLTGGPHAVWGAGSPWGALDFAPTGVVGCESSDEWVTSAAPGLVVRTETGLVMVDLDGDGYEQSGWNILYLHIYDQDSAEEGEFVYLNDLIGHPSCSGGSSTGTHVHIARKYNGEWMPADNPVPFILSGWQAYSGSAPYEGKLFNNGQTINASTCSDASSLIIRRE